MKKHITLLILVLVCFSCKKETKEVEIKTNTAIVETVKADPFTNAIELAHNKESFLNHNAVKFDIDLIFGGRQILDATISVSTDSRQSIIELKNGESIYISDDKVYVSEGVKDDASVRFSAYTWSYFFLFPYKLNDGGTKWNDYSPSHSDVDLNTKKLSFESGIGDAPEDWYVVYSNKNTNVLEHAAYIVTLGKTKEEAEEDPHAIQYLDYKVVDGIPFAHNWVFWEWREQQGLTNTIGNASLSNIEFIEDFKSNFSIPEGFVER